MDRHPASMTSRRRSRGQIAVIFAAAMIVVIALCAIVVDVSWFWANSLRMQRAADAAALAGVVLLPGDEANAIVRAKAEAAKNGYTDGASGVTVTAWQDPTNPRRLRVNLTANIGTFFARVVGINSFPAGVQSKADYTLPVPMGSPENYYGVFGTVRHPGGGVTTVTTNSFPNTTTSYFSASTAPTPTWTTPTNAYTSNNAWATSTTANQYQTFGGFNITLNSTVSNIDGIEVSAEVSKTGTGASCQIQFEVSGNAGGAWTTGSGVKLTPVLTTTDTYQSLGNATDTWNMSGGWSTTKLSNANFMVRARTIKTSTAACAAAAVVRIDHLRVRVTYDYSTTTSVFTPDSNLTSPYGAALNPRGFWGTMLTQGADNINGDAYSPAYDQKSAGAANPNYNTTDYYNYAVEVPAGATAGEVWVYDPGFCAVAADMGTGDRYFSNGTTNGSNEISAFYRLYNTQNTLYDSTDDTLVATSGNTFKDLGASDASMNGPATGGAVADCSAAAVGSDTSNPEYYHNRWWQLATGLTGGSAGTVYRLHVTSTDPNSPSAQANMNGQNSFALWSKATGGTPKIYGLGAMEAYSPLPQNQTSVFYLAQIGAEHAGKTLQIKLWDPGDTNGLTGTISILIPGAAGYTTATMSYTAAQGTTNSGASNCNSSTGTNVTSITAASGSTSYFNGCWITALVTIPASYTAPTPPGETQPGWWKISYAMGAGSSASYDLTTWQVEIRGNPVHLVLP